MSEKSGYPAGSAPPPPPANYQPYPAGAPPPYSSAPPMYPAAGAAAPQQYHAPPPAQHTTVIVQQKPVRPQPKVQTSHGLFGFMNKELNAMGRMIDHEINAASNTILGTVDQHVVTHLLNNFVTNNVLQLVSRSSGRTLQIVTSQSNPSSPPMLVLDGCGQEGSQASNASWTVINEGKNQIRLHNNYNYIAIVNGHTVLVNVPPGQPFGIETKLQLSQVPGTQFVTLMSLKESNRHVGILQSGQLKSALATGKEQNAHFAVRLIHSPYPPPARK